MELVFYTYTFVPIVLISIAIVSFVIGLIKKRKNKNHIIFWIVSAVLLIWGIVVFLVMPVLALIFGFGPGLLD